MGVVCLLEPLAFSPKEKNTKKTNIGHASIRNTQPGAKRQRPIDRPSRRGLAHGRQSGQLSHRGHLPAAADGGQRRRSAPTRTPRWRSARRAFTSSDAVPVIVVMQSPHPLSRITRVLHNPPSTFCPPTSSWAPTPGRCRRTCSLQTSRALRACACATSRGARLDGEGGARAVFLVVHPLISRRLFCIPAYQSPRPQDMSSHMFFKNN